jgi:hypothetical protein
MPRFRQDNTEGYSDADLVALNEAYEQAMADNYSEGLVPDSIEYKSWQDHVAERVQADFDEGTGNETRSR